MRIIHLLIKIIATKRVNRKKVEEEKMKKGLKNLKSFWSKIINIKMKSE